MKEYSLMKIMIDNLIVYKVIYNFDIENINPVKKFTHLIVHHTKNCRTLQDIIDLHVHENKWSSIGYHFVIGKTGKIYLTRDLKYAGSHTFGFNKFSIGVALIGNFDNEEPNDLQLTSLKKLALLLKKKYGIKILMGHVEATYDYLKKKYPLIKFENITILEIETKLSLDIFLLDVKKKVLEFDSSESNSIFVKKLTSCPGFYSYKHILRLRNNYF